LWTPGGFRYEQDGHSFGLGAGRSGRIGAREPRVRDHQIADLRARHEQPGGAGPIAAVEPGAIDPDVVAAGIDAHGLEVIQQVLAKARPFVITGKVFACQGGDDPDIHGHRPATGIGHFAAFRHAQHAPLHQGRHGLRPIQKQRSALSLGNQPTTQARPEQCFVNHRIGDRRAIDADEGARTSGASLVQQSGNQLLAGASLAFDQNIDVRWCDPLDQIPQLTHVVEHLGVDVDAMSRDLDRDGRTVWSEMLLYHVAQTHGRATAHELIRNASDAWRPGRDLPQILAADPAIAPAVIPETLPDKETVDLILAAGGTIVDRVVAEIRDYVKGKQ